MNLADTPFLIPPHEQGDLGRDFLGLEALNMAMFDRFFTGTNNVVSQIRPSSLLTWAVWKYREVSGGDISANGFKQYREKLEVLFVWSHKLNDAHAGMPGADQSAPAENKMTFFAVNRASAAYWSATTYGPSLKDPNGIGLIFQIIDFPGIFKVTKAGEKLAKEFDRQLRKLKKPDYDFLASMDLTISAERASHFYEIWRKDAPTAGESEAYREAFYRPSLSGTNVLHGQRANAVAFVLATLATAPADTAITPALLRRQMTYGPCPTSKGAIPQQQMERVRKQWQALQIRQHQRLALEALFGWLERCIWRLDAASITEICGLTIAAVRAHDLNPDTLLSRKLTFYKSAADRGDQLFAKGFGPDSQLDLMQKGLELVSIASDTFIQDILPIKAIDLLCHCAILTEKMLHDDQSNREIFFPEQVSRLPPTWLVEFLNQLEHKSFSLFIEQLFEVHIFARHLGVAATRFSDDKNRARFSFEDSGLRSIIPSADKVLQPGFGGDRLSNSMQLIAECGLLARTAGVDYAGMSDELLATVLKDQNSVGWFKLGPAAVY